MSWIIQATCTEWIIIKIEVSYQMKFKPHVYQDHAINTIISNNASGLFLEMGLGKTVCTLTAIEELMYDYFHISRVLVIAPKKVAENTWTDEVKKWDHIKHLKVVTVLGKVKKRIEALQTTADVYVINRENIVWLIEQYGKYSDKKKKTGFKLTREWPFDMVVIDELSSFKSPKSKRFKMLKKIRPAMFRVVGLTGTPAPNGLLDLWPQVYLLDSGQRLGLTATAYRDRYFAPGSMIKNHAGVLINTDYQPRPGATDAIYDAIDDICLSMKSEDWLDMPPRLDNNVMLKMDPKDYAKYKELEKEFILELGDVTIDAASAASVSQKLHQLAQGAIYRETGTTEYVEVHNSKLEVLDEIVEGSQGKPILVFYWFKHDRDRLLKKYPTARELNTPEDLQAWNDGKISVLLAHPASAGHGLNLQAGGSTIVWFSLTWSLELYQQANARLHRQGQKESVVIHHLVMRDTVDENILAAIEQKADVQNALMDAVKAVIALYR